MVTMVQLPYPMGHPRLMDPPHPGVSAATAPHPKWLLLCQISLSSEQITAKFRLLAVAFELQQQCVIQSASQAAF